MQEDSQKEALRTMALLPVLMMLFYLTPIFWSLAMIEDNHWLDNARAANRAAQTLAAAAPAMRMACSA